MAADRVTWSVENAGAVAYLDPSVPRDYVKLAGAHGLGVAPTVVQVDTSVTGGGTWRSTTRGVREVTMPVGTFGNGRADIEVKLRALVRLFNDQFSTPKLVATYPDGSQFETEVHYSGGADHVWGSGDTDGRTYCRWTLGLTAPSPYFTSRTPQQYVVRPTAGRGLLQHPASLSALRLTPGQTVGTIQVNNPGDVASFATWTFQGPASGFTITRNVDGSVLNYTTSLTAATTVTVNGRAKTVTASDGSNLYGGLVGAPKFATIPPGQSSFTIALPGTTSASKATLSFLERRELVF